MDAAERAGLDGIGIADHCHVPGGDALLAPRDAVGFHLDLPYERRRVDALEAHLDGLDVYPVTLDI